MFQNIFRQTKFPKAKIFFDAIFDFSKFFFADVIQIFSDPKLLRKMQIKKSPKNLISNTFITTIPNAAYRTLCVFITLNVLKSRHI